MGDCYSMTGSHLIRGLITTITTPRGASVGTRDTRDSSFKFKHAAVIKLLIRLLPVTHIDYLYV